MSIKKNKILRQIGEDLWGNFKQISYKKKHAAQARQKKENKNSKPKNFLYSSTKSVIKKLTKTELLHYLRKFYINISKKQFNLLKNKSNIKQPLSQLIERRIDTVVYRLNYARSFSEARQMISHGHVIINGHYITKPSHLLNIGDKIEISRKFSPYVKNLILNQIKNKTLHINCPRYLEANYNILTAVLITNPNIKDIPYPTLNNQHEIQYHNF